MKHLIVANWKMNPTTAKEAQRMFLALKRGVKNTKAEIVVCPPFVYLPLALEFFGGRKKITVKADKSCDRKICKVALGAQDCFWEERGAFTSEVSPLMLKDLKVKYVIVGHSERRQVLGESDEIVNKKLKAVLKVGLTPIFCIGETAAQRRGGETFKVLEREIRQGLKKVPKSQVEKVAIAYEPIWAIGTGSNCSADDALTAALFIRKVMARLFNKKIGRSIKVLYGGSVNAQDALDYLTTDWLNGLLVGGVSLRPKEFLEIVAGSE